MPSASEQVIREIFDRDLGWFRPYETQRIEVATIEQLEEMAGLLAEDAPEEKLHQFIARNPQILTGNFGWGDDATLAFFSKPPVGNRFEADFCVLHYGQGGCEVHLVEIEPNSAGLFNKDLAESSALRAPIKQIEDWHQWISVNRDTFVRDAVAAAKRLPLYPERKPGGSYRSRAPGEIEQLWNGFGGFTDPGIRYHIVIGRWARMSQEEQQRLLFLNRNKNELYDVTTFDQLARRAFDRPYLRY